MAALVQTRLVLWATIPIVVFNAGLLLEDITGTDQSPHWVHVLHSALALVILPVALAAAFGWTRTIAAIRDRERRLVRDGDARRRSESLRRAVRSIVAAGDTMRIVYQPVIDLDRGRVVGYEALARFGDGRPPNLWFDDAHAVGMGIELELQAIAKALEGFDDDGAYIAVNASPATLMSGRISDLVRAADASVVVEITEHAAIHEYDRIVAACNAVHDAGGRVAIDDVGNGNATLRNVVDLKPDIIKLDASLICHIDVDAARREMAASLVGFADSMGWGIIAEGIEREAELCACQEVGVRWGQGFLLGRPGELRADDPCYRLGNTA
jgi:EAL domain-containing protein (putative c-di-GMP-specific phosphodiesterase class I)